MTIGSLADYHASRRDRALLYKTFSHAAFSGAWMTLWDGTGNPGAATLAVGNTANGVVPTNATTGALPLSFSGTTGYLSVVEPMSTAASNCRPLLYDRLFHAGAFPFNAAVTLTAQPSYSSRVPGGNYAGLQIYFEGVTTFTGNPNVTVTYTNENGVTGQSTGTIAIGSGWLVGGTQHLPLQAGDAGVQMIESVTCTVASVGTFNIFVARPLVSLRCAAGEPPQRLWLDRTGMPRVFPDSCLALLARPDGSSTPTVEFALEIASK